MGRGKSCGTNFMWTKMERLRKTAWTAECNGVVIHHVRRAHQIEKVAPVAQLDRAFASGAKGQGFESLRARHR